jgi:CheY-like chemotaxis protein
MVSSDRDGLQKILYLLLDNGIKYRDAGKPSPSEVTVRLSLHAHGSIIDIEDNGLGIAENSLSRGAIFKPFFKGGKTRDEQEPGAGLSLCIVQALMNQLPGHELQLNSKLGVGTSLRLTLPCTELELPQPNTTPQPGPCLEDQLAPDPLRGCYVLLVDDDVTEAQTLCQWFSTSGILYECVASFQELQDCVEKMERLPDVLISSMHLPQDKTVVDVIQLVTEWFDAVPLLLLSSLNIDSQTAAALQCQAVITRPLTPSQLWSAIRQTAAPDRPAAAES